MQLLQHLNNNASIPTRLNGQIALSIHVNAITKMRLFQVNAIISRWHFHLPSFIYRSLFFANSRFFFSLYFQKLFFK